MFARGVLKTMMTAALLPFVEVDMVHHPRSCRYHALGNPQTAEVHPSKRLNCGEEYFENAGKCSIAKVKVARQRIGLCGLWLSETRTLRILCSTCAVKKSKNRELIVSSLLRVNLEPIIVIDPARQFARIYPGAKVYEVRILLELRRTFTF